MTVKHKSSRTGIALFHGGPGADHSLDPLLDWFKNQRDVCLVSQKNTVIKNLLSDIKLQLDALKYDNFILIGHSWGAWLAGLFAAEYPEITEKLVLISCGPIQPDGSESTELIRRSRLNKNENEKFSALLNAIYSDDLIIAQKALASLQKICFITDNWQAMNEFNIVFPVNIQQFKSLSWEMFQIRKSGVLLNSFMQISCPVCSIHGTYDPHIPEEVSKVFQDHTAFKQWILPKCGHTPWIESKAKANFYTILYELLEM